MRLAVAVILSGITCTSAAMAGRANPFASFETRCEALPPARIQVFAVPVTFTENTAQSLRTLSRKQHGLPARHRTIGLTQARLAYTSTLETNGLEDRGRRRVCARPSIEVVFTATPMTVFIAREFAADPCRRAAIRDHELKHVAVYREYLYELVTLAERDLAGVFGDRVIYAHDLHASEIAMRDRLHDFMREFMRARYAELKARQAAVDSPEEYARLDQVCTRPTQD